MFHFKRTQSARFFSMTWPITLELLLTGVINTGSTYLLNQYSQEAVAVVGSLSLISGKQFYYHKHCKCSRLHSAGEIP